jgi:uroporphyrinogen-III synthase
MTSALLGKRIVNTRAPHQSGELDRLLRVRGATPLAYPCIAIAPPAETSALDAALRDLVAGRFDWLVLTSANTVRAIAERLAWLDLRLPVAPAFATAAIGLTTAETAETALGLRQIVTPPEERGEALARAIPARAGSRVLCPVSEIARPEAAELLRQRGAEVTVVTAYRTVTGSGGVDLPRLLACRRVDAVTFASPSAVAGFVARLDAEGGDLADLAGLAVVCLGPLTHDAARSRGLERALVSTKPTLPALIETLEAALEPSAEGAGSW